MTNDRGDVPPSEDEPRTAPADGERGRALHHPLDEDRPDDAGDRGDGRRDLADDVESGGP